MLQQIHYFSYGSNMLRERLENRVGKVKKADIVTLPDYELAFNCGHLNYSYANVTPKAGAKVEGIAYLLTDPQIRMLDQHECYPHNYEKFHFFANDKLMYGYWSVSKNFKTDACPLNWYLDLLIDGAKENNLTFTLNKLKEYKRTHKLVEWNDDFLY